MFEEDPRFSPRDDIDRFISLSSELDEEVMAQADIHKKSDVFRSKINGLLEIVPFLIGQEVIGSGQVAQRLDEASSDEYGTGLLLTREELPRIRSKGVFQTSRILPIVMGGEVLNRFVHTIEESSESLTSRHFDPRPQPTWENIAASGALLFPTEPINAHSIKEMDNDALTLYYDKVMSESESEEFGELEKIKAVGDMMNHLLELTGHAPNRINHRRVSWLNSRGRVQGRKIHAVNFVQGFPKIGESRKGWTFSNMDIETEIIAGNFTVLESYSRTEGSSKVYFEGKKTLYLRGKAGDIDVAVPVSNILSLDPKSDL